MARTDPQLNFRIPTELRDKLTEAARVNNRSMTGELIARLEASFEERPQSELVVQMQSVPKLGLDPEISDQLKDLKEEVRSVKQNQQLLASSLDSGGLIRLQEQIKKVLAEMRLSNTKEEFEQRISDALDKSDGTPPVRKDEAAEAAQPESSSGRPPGRKLRLGLNK